MSNWGAQWSLLAEQTCRQQLTAQLLFLPSCQFHSKGAKHILISWGQYSYKWQVPCATLLNTKQTAHLNISTLNHNNLMSRMNNIIVFQPYVSKTVTIRSTSTYPGLLEYSVFRETTRPTVFIVSSIWVMDFLQEAPWGEKTTECQQPQH